MNSKYKDLDLTVRRYVAKKMSEEEAIEFEDFFIAKPEIIDMVEEAQAMKTGLLELEKSSSSISFEQPQSTQSLTGKLASIVSTPIPGYAAFAASVVVALGVGYGNTNSYSDSQPTIIAFGGENVRSDIPDSEFFKELEIDLENLGSPRIISFKIRNPKTEYFTAQLKEGSSGEIIWTSDKFKLGNFRNYTLGLPSNIDRKVVLTIEPLEKGTTSSPIEFCSTFSRC